MHKYEVGDKVVMEITDKISVMGEPWYVLSEATSIFETYLDKAAEPLGTYTEPLEAKIRRQAAEITRLLAKNKGLKEDFEKSKRVNLNMGRVAGQNEAWELARKIFDMETNDIEDIFIKEDAWNLGTVLNNYTYQEAAAKVAQWEKEKEEIKAGDIINHGEYDEDLCVLCMSTDKKYYNAVDRYGTVYCMLSKEMITKTGRHIDIDSFLKQIGGEQE